jgi:hypothetical protein
MLAGNQQQPSKIYDRQSILCINNKSKGIQSKMWIETFNPLLKELKLQYVKCSKKRGKRCGVRKKIRTLTHQKYLSTTLPSILLLNARSLVNKIDELELLIHSKDLLKSCCIIAVTETWLHSNISDTQMNLAGFNALRFDRAASSNKSIGGGLMMFITEKWAGGFRTISHHCQQFLETAANKIRPYRSPRNISSIIFLLIYAPVFSSSRSTVVKETTQELHQQIDNLERI